MLKEILFTYLIVSCVSIGLARSADKLYDGNFMDSDLFQAMRINWHDLNLSSTMQKLNDFLVERTDSIDPDENFDIVLEELLLDYKKHTGPSKAIKTKRFFLLSAL